MALLNVPPGIGPAGTELWKTVTSDYRFNGAELALLASAARTLDELARLEAALADAPVVIIGSKGQPAAHPILARVLAHRRALAALLESLKLDAEVPVERSIRSVRRVGA